MEAMYGRLAGWWPALSPVEAYEREAAFVAACLAGRRTVLELGSGGGHLSTWLARRFSMTLSDLSDAMLDVSRALNTHCRHVRGDMRSLRLGERFDAVLVHDAIGYMTSEADLAATFTTAAAHLRVGGALLVVPDHTRETWAPWTARGGGDGAGGIGAWFRGECWDPDPTDSRVSTRYELEVRRADGAVEAQDEVHELGLFAVDVWVRLLGEAGFDVDVRWTNARAGAPARVAFLAILREEAG